MTTAATTARTSAKGSIWHLVKVFCSFFSLIATFSAVLVLTEVRTHYVGLLMFGWVLGVIAAILVAPGKFVKFGGVIMGACATFGWFLLPFPLDLVTVAASLAVGLVAVLMALFCIPAIFTIYTYITDIRYDCRDWKKDLIAAASGLGAALLIAVLFLTLHGITKAVEAPMMEKRFDPVTAYELYTEKNLNAPTCPAEVLQNPTSTEETDDGYVRINRYTYSVKEENLYFDYDLEVTFDYTDGKWSVTSAKQIKDVTGFDPISGTWKGEGKFFGNLSLSNEYTLTLDQVTESGGTATLEIYLEDTTDERKSCTVQAENLRISTYDDEVLVDLILTPEDPITYLVFGSSDEIGEVQFTMSLTNNTASTLTFSFSEIVLTQ